MIEILRDTVGIFLALFTVMLFVSQRGSVSNSRISLFSMVVVIYENGDDNFSAVENETVE